METSHGMSEEFSTGSHPQYPPQPNTPYAQYAPSMIPKPRTNPEKRIHGKALLSHEVNSFRHNAATAKLNGIAVNAKPTNKTGGWMTIQKFWSSGFNPFPSCG